MTQFLLVRNILYVISPKGVMPGKESKNLRDEWLKELRLLWIL
jgi:hypothetical protein